MTSLTYRSAQVDVILATSGLALGRGDGVELEAADDEVLQHFLGFVVADQTAQFWLDDVTNQLRV